MVEKSNNKNNKKSIKTTSNISKVINRRGCISDNNNLVTSVVESTATGTGRKVVENYSEDASNRKKYQHHHHQQKDISNSNLTSTSLTVASISNKDKKKSPRIQHIQSTRTIKDQNFENDKKRNTIMQNKNEKQIIVETDNEIIVKQNKNVAENVNRINVIESKEQKEEVTNVQSELETENKKQQTNNISTKDICDRKNSVINSISSDIDDKNAIKNSSEITTQATKIITEKTVEEEKEEIKIFEIPEVLRKQGTATLCSSNADNLCPCNTMEDIQQVSRKISYCDRRNWISVERMNELRKRAQEAIKHHKTFTIRGCFFSIRNALVARGWVEKLDVHRRHNMNGICQTNYEDLTNTLPKRRPGETRRQYLIKCERNIMSRFLEHMPIDFLWTARKEKCDWIDQAKNPIMIINKFHNVPFTSKEGLCAQLKDFHWFYEENVSDLYFPRCYNVWSPEELNEFIDNFRLTGCVGFLKFIVDKCRNKKDEKCNNSDKKSTTKTNKILEKNCEDEIFSENGKIPISSIDFAFKRCNEFIDNCNHNDIDMEETSIRIWDHDWDAFLTYHYILTHENAKIQIDSNRLIETIIKNAEKILENIKIFCPQYNLDGHLNIWIIKPANKCRGRGIYLMNNLRKILNMINPSISTKSRFVIQKYIERPLIIHGTKFDIRQWFLVTSAQPLIIWMYKESYLRFSSQEYNLKNYHESVHLTNHAVQKKYRNDDERDKRLPNENMWDCYTFQAYLRQIGQHKMWDERIYPGMKYAITGAMLASQENMDRRTNTFELFGADFMITEDFYPWLIEINSSPDLGATTSVTARMCPQCLEDIIKVVIDRRHDIKADTGSFEMIYRQTIPAAPAYMGLNLFIKGKQISAKNLTLRRERTMPSLYKQHHLSAGYHSTLSLIEKSPSSEIAKASAVNFYDDTILLPYEDGADQDNLLHGKSSSSNLNDDCTNIGSDIDLNSGSNKMLSSFFPNSKNSLIPPLSIPKFLSPWKNGNGNEKEWRRPSDVNLKTSQIISRRHLSCGPRLITTTNTTKSQDTPRLQENIDKIENSLIATTVTDNNNIECIGNKCSLDNLNLATDYDLNSKISPRSVITNLIQRKQLCDVTYKPKSSRLQKRDVAKQNVIKPKSPVLYNNSNCNLVNNKSQIIKNIPVKKLKKLENTQNKIGLTKYSNNDYYSSNFHTSGMSLRAWKSKQYKLWKESDDSSLSRLVSYKNLSRNNVVNGSTGYSPKRRLCKKLTENFGRGFTGGQ